MMIMNMYVCVSTVSDWLSANMLVSINIGTHSMPGRVSASMSDCKPPPHRTRHPGQLSLSYPSVGRHNEYPAKAGE